jgi:CheY-like chemotaxis protein
MTSRITSILWVDDEMELLRPHILFLEEKGFQVVTCTNGSDAIVKVGAQSFDLIFLDENMPGLSGLETLNSIKLLRPDIPVIMITKSEEEDIMDQAIGSKIADYLIKPVNPMQILLTIKKHTQTRELVTQKTTADYRTEFSRIGTRINEARTFETWCEIYRKIVYWELELESSTDSGMEEIIRLQKAEANQEFSRFIRSNYLDWFDDKNTTKPLMSPSLLRQKVFQLVDEGHKTVLIVIDNLRFDQWIMLHNLIRDFLVLENEELYCSILPTVTQFARNALFAGLMPMEIESIFPDLWVDEEDEESKNRFEEDLLNKQLSRLGRNYKVLYEKISNVRAGQKFLENISNIQSYDLTTVVYNFVDMLSHARTEMEVIRELANDEAAYRSISQSWFQHSHLFDMLRELSKLPVKLVITTDHGSVRVNNPIKVIGDRATSTNLRYKQGRNLNYNPKEVFEVKQPARIHLPSPAMTTSYIFAQHYDYLVYPNNYNHFVNFYRNTFQHGGISMEEMIIPIATLSPK